VLDGPREQDADERVEQPGENHDTSPIP
jgi:hypothetical protein